MRKICVFLGGRANYSSIKTAMRAIKEHPELTLQVILAGQEGPVYHFRCVSDLLPYTFHAGFLP